MTQTEELGPLGTAGVAAIVAAYLVSNPSMLSSMPLVRWVMIIGMVCTAVVGIVIGIREL